MMIRAVLFDLGNTLVSYYLRTDFPSILRASLSACASSLGFNGDQEDLFERAWRLNVETVDHAVHPLAERLHELLGQGGTVDEHNLDVACDAFLQPIFALGKLDAEAPAVLDSLRKRGIKTAIVSNTPWGSPAAAWREELVRLGLFDRVDATVFCMDVGFRKPHAAPFRRALDLLSVAPAEAMFVGDEPQWDVIGARDAGLRPVLFASSPSGVGNGCLTIGRLTDVLDLVP